VAGELGQPAAVRAVGAALGRNPIPVLIPCHRVSAATAACTGYAWGVGYKRTLLAAEGADPDELERLGRRGTRFFGSDTTPSTATPPAPTPAGSPAATSCGFPAWPRRPPPATALPRLCRPAGPPGTA
jgi:O-6-methylguanine DNA methyltransferase